MSARKGIADTAPLTHESDAVHGRDPRPGRCDRVGHIGVNRPNHVRAGAENNGLREVSITIACDMRSGSPRGDARLCDENARCCLDANLVPAR